ncbi:hypothetical protein B0A49_00036 [Cryomyces minteri]|uniref:WSC domain-containing protein n=1 Tax=Cryomyces minteri TaxID=331657 RepID=A0A4U0XZK7_9PEZI|nr:hypothetical protein B0A49_00036 [Cryomyces minteri]
MFAKAVPVLGLILASALIDSVDAFWRMNCAVIQTGRVDPVVNPGKLAAHAHTIIGASNIGVNATHDSLLNSACTSCEITADKSAYWTPLLYYEHANGSFEEVPHAGSVVYYLGRGANRANIQPFPKGFMMLSGNSALRSYDNTTMTYSNSQYKGRPIADRVSFNCLDVAPMAEQPWMFNTSCRNGMRAQIHFQSCWNGVDLYKSDNGHVAYMSAIDDGICPPTHPVQLVHLFIETLYSVSSVVTSDGGRFVFSQGDPTGYGFHGDFQNGWDMDVQTVAVQNCANTDNAGQISACPILQASQTSAYRENCPEMPAQIGEPVHGTLAKLPGCINVVSGPANAASTDMSCPAGSILSPISTTKDSTPRATATAAVGGSFGLDGYKYLGCANDTAGGVRTLNALRTVNPTNMTVEYCQAYCMSRGYRYAGVEFGQECYCDNSINPTAVFGIGACYYQCTGNNTEMCGGSSRMMIYNNTSPSFVPTTSTSGNAAAAVASTAAMAAVPAAPYASNYVGCASDLVTNSARALNETSLASVNMTVELCATFCTVTNSYAYYGLEYANQCYCGNSLASGGAILTATSSPANSTCSMRCAGNATEVCGGSAKLTVYQNTAYVAPVIQPSVGKYVAKGCVTDPNTSGRALAGAAYTSKTAMTADSCVKFCLGKGFKYAGVETAGATVARSTPDRKVIRSNRVWFKTKMRYLFG